MPDSVHCFVLFFFFHANSNHPIYGFIVHMLLVFLERPFFNWSTLKVPTPAEVSLSKAVKPLYISFVLQRRTDLQGSIKFHIILHENISRKWWQSNYESATVKRQWDYRFTRGVGFFYNYTGEKSTSQWLRAAGSRFVIMDPEGKVVASPF